MVHGAVPVKAIFKGLPHIQKMCNTCRKQQAETLNHAFFECEGVWPALESLINTFKNTRVQLTTEKIIAPDSDFTQQQFATLALYFCAVWAKRAATREAKVYDIKNEFLQRLQRRL